MCPWQSVDPIFEEVGVEVEWKVLWDQAILVIIVFILVVIHEALVIPQGAADLRKHLKWKVVKDFATY